MRAAVMYVPGDVRVEDRPEPMIFAPTDTIIRLTATRSRQIDAGKVFDPELPLDQADAGYQAVDARQAIKVLLRP
jgi:threonine dehydrogenase-like Zn-dependent dehydrogenase